MLVVAAVTLQPTDRRTGGACGRGALVGPGGARWRAKRTSLPCHLLSSSFSLSLCASLAHAHSAVTRQTPATTSLAHLPISLFFKPELCRQIFGQAYGYFIRTVCNTHLIVWTHAAHARLCEAAIGPTQTLRGTSPSAPPPPGLSRSSLSSESPARHAK